MVEKSWKRIPVTPEMWAELHDARRPGETYDTCIQRILDGYSEYQLLQDLKKIEKDGEFVPL